MGFVRQLDKKRIENLLNKNLAEGRIFTSLLFPYIMAGQIFMAVRNDKVDFYVGGNRFLSYYDGSFKANPKIYGKSEKSKMLQIDSVFERGWENEFPLLQRQCYEYSSAGSSQAERKIIQSYFPVYGRRDKVMVLDREIRINDGCGRKCDWLLYDTVSRRLKFVEVKMSGNAGLKKHKDGTIDAAAQIDGYSRQYEEHELEIVKQYQNYVDIINELLGIDLPRPEGMLDTRAGLAIFGAREEINEDLIKQVNPFIGEVPAATLTPVSIDEIWKHFCDMI